MRELSIFVDESGDFSHYCKPSNAFCIVSFVLHEQDKDISQAIEALNSTLNFLGFEDCVAHAMPLIRKNNEFGDFHIKDRLAVFNKIFDFVSNAPISYKNIVVCKKFKKSPKEIMDDVSGQLNAFLSNNMEYFTSFDKIIVYYDSGQNHLKSTLKSVLGKAFGKHIDFRMVIKPCDYKLFQAADFICTLELIIQKLNTGIGFNNNEKYFFRSEARFRNKYLQHIERLKF